MSEGLSSSNRRIHEENRWSEPNPKNLRESRRHCFGKNENEESLWEVLYSEQFQTFQLTRNEEIAEKDFLFGFSNFRFLEAKGEMRIRFGKWFLFFYLLASIDRRLRSFLAAGSSTVDLERHPSLWWALWSFCVKVGLLLVFRASHFQGFCQSGKCNPPLISGLEYHKSASLVNRLKACTVLFYGFRPNTRSESDVSFVEGIVEFLFWLRK